MNVKQIVACSAFVILLLGCSQEVEQGTEIERAEVENLEATNINAAASNSETATESDSQSPPPSFIPTDFEPPILVTTQGFKIVPLGPELVQIDFEAYMSSIEHLQKTFTRSTNWPRKDISDADAMLDMETEKTRFENRESFAYAILTPDGTRERGCIYVYPSNIEGYDAVVRMWVTKAEYDANFDEELFAWAQQWLASDWPFENVAYPGRTIAWEKWDALVAENEAKADELTRQNQKTAEAFIDAFYSFDPKQLQTFLHKAPESAPRITYYQGWAEGGNYIVLNRGACEAASPTAFNCPITVQDDPVVALKTGFNVTDTFHLNFEGNDIVSIETSSNDQPIYYEARKWVEANMPEVMTGPCLDRNKGGKTPGDCARAMSDGYKQFYAATREAVKAP